MDGRRGAVAGWSGHVIGGAGGYFCGSLVSTWVIPESTGLEGLLYWVWGAAIGMWLGAIAGAALGVRLVGQNPLTSNAFWFAASLPLGFAGLLLAAGLTDSDDRLNTVLPAAVTAGSVALMAFFARRMAGYMTSRLRPRH